MTVVKQDKKTVDSTTNVLYTEKVDILKMGEAYE